MSVLIGQKLLENAKIDKFICDVLGDFQTLCARYTYSSSGVFPDFTVKFIQRAIIV